MIIYFNLMLIKIYYIEAKTLCIEKLLNFIKVIFFDK